MGTTFGEQDASYRAAGEEQGIRRLCEAFYHEMETLPEAKRIRQMHADELEVMIDKLTLFLCAWLGGPNHYREKYGFKSMPEAHQHLEIGETERDAWLLCMNRALEQQPYSKEFKDYLREQFKFPAERIRQVCSFNSRNRQR